MLDATVSLFLGLRFRYNGPYGPFSAAHASTMPLFVGCILVLKNGEASCRR